MSKYILFAIALFAGICSTSQAATIAWSAQSTNGFSLSDDTPLQNTSLIRLGTFTGLTDSQIQTDFLASNFSALESAWVQADTARIPDGAGSPGFFAKNSTVDTSIPPALVGQQIYMWAYSSTDNSSVASSIGSATQMGIYYMDKAVNSAWAFPVETPIPGSTSIDLNDLTNPLTSPSGNALVAGAHVVVGSFPGAISVDSGSPFFRLEQVPVGVPEPSRAILALVGLGLAVSRRRRP